MAAIGLACRAALYLPAIATTSILLAILIALKPIERQFFAHKRAWLVTVHALQQTGLLAALEAGIHASGLELSRMQLEPSKENAEMGKVRRITSATAVTAGGLKPS